MPLKPLDVIWIYDEFIRPPGPKMVVCIEPRLGLFFRINTEGKWQTPIKLEKAGHPFLTRDSHLECGEPLELDDYIVEQSLRGKGVIGTIIPQLASRIFQVVDAARTISAADKEIIRKALGC